MHVIYLQVAAVWTSAALPDLWPMRGRGQYGHGTVKWPEEGLVPRAGPGKGPGQGRNGWVSGSVQSTPRERLAMVPTPTMYGPIVPKV